MTPPRGDPRWGFERHRPCRLAASSKPFEKEPRRHRQGVPRGLSPTWACQVHFLTPLTSCIWLLTGRPEAQSVNKMRISQLEVSFQFGVNVHLGEFVQSLFYSFRVTLGVTLGVACKLKQAFLGNQRI